MTTKTKHLKFASKEEANSVFAPYMVSYKDMSGNMQTSWPSYINGVAVSIVGVVYEVVTPYDPEKPDVQPVYKPRDGYYVNLSSRLAQFYQYEVTPDFPLPLFAEAPIVAQKLERRTFRALFTDAELLDVTTKAQTDPNIRRWLDESLAADFITIDDPATVQGLAYLVIIGVLTEERKDYITAAMQ